MKVKGTAFSGQESFVGRVLEEGSSHGFEEC